MGGVEGGELFKEGCFFGDGEGVVEGEDLFLVGGFVFLLEGGEGGIGGFSWRGTSVFVTSKVENFLDSIHDCDLGVVWNGKLQLRVWEMLMGFVQWCCTSYIQVEVHVAQSSAPPKVTSSTRAMITLQYGKSNFIGLQIRENGRKTELPHSNREFREYYDFS